MFGLKLKKALVIFTHLKFCVTVETTSKWVKISKLVLKGLILNAMWCGISDTGVEGLMLTGKCCIYTSSN